jgi:hypothetical protein
MFEVYELDTPVCSEYDSLVYEANRIEDVYLKIDEMLDTTCEDCGLNDEKCRDCPINDIKKEQIIDLIKSVNLGDTIEKDLNEFTIKLKRYEMDKIDFDELLEQDEDDDTSKDRTGSYQP